MSEQYEKPAVEVLESQRHGTLYSTPETRNIQWNSGGITFLERGLIIAIVNFPCGPQGPIDGTVGSKERLKWEGVRHAWIEHQMLPDGAYWPKALPRNAWSKQFILEEK